MEEEARLWNSNYTKIWWANFMIFFSFMLLMPLLPIYMKETFHSDKHIIGIVLSGYTVMALVSRLFSGYIVDSFPRKRVLLISYFLFSFFFSGYIFAGSLIFFAIVRTLHGAPFGTTTVANSTVAIDVLHPSRRAEGIGFYGLSNNIATAISPSVAIWLYHLTQNYTLIFACALFFSTLGVAINSTVHVPQKEIPQREDRHISLDRVFLLPAWSEALSLICLAFSYGVLSTYVAIYGKEELNIEGGAGFFFMLLALGLILARLLGSKSLREGKVTENAGVGCLISLVGYFLFAAIHAEWSYYGSALIIGLGNGLMFPAFQTMFINLAPHTKRGTANSSQLVSWDVGTGFGILLGGVISEYFGYVNAFWMAWLVNLFGVIAFFVYVRKSFLKNRLR